MIVGVPKESYPGERRVALVPAVVPSLTKAGFEVSIESGAGASAGYPDAQYTEKGAKIAASRADLFASADIVLQVLGPGANDVTGNADLALYRKGQVVVGFLRPLASAQDTGRLASSGVTSFAVELVPRITRAQSMDALSSMATVSGYKAVLMAANVSPRFFPMMTTAAGTITPARVLIVGVGVAGLQAISTARRLGAVASAYDIRPAVKEQVQSLGGKFVELPLEITGAQDTRGYGTQQSEDVIKKQRELLATTVGGSDVVITTAVVPGKKAPILVTADMVKGMAPGSVLIDLAAERGGNCELTKPGETTIQHGVSIVGPINLAGTVPYHASQMYARNLMTLLVYLAKDGKLQFNMQDEVTRETMLTREGEIVSPRVREFFQLPALATAG